MSLWGRIFAAFYDRGMEGMDSAGLGERRQRLLSAAHGSVIEIGAGTGLNLGRYPVDGIDELVLVEPEEPMARRLEARLARSGRSARVVRAPAENLPIPDHSFDVAVSTLVLCTVHDQAKSLSELRRVLKPDGSLLFLEHVRADDERLAKWQDRIHPFWVRLGHGCHCNRPTLDAITVAGFQVRDVEHSTMPTAPAFVRPMIVGLASRG